LTLPGIDPGTFRLINAKV
jgi:hypothetical protein